MNTTCLGVWCPWTPEKIGRIPDGGGWKAHGRTHGQTGAQKRAKIGVDDIHSVVDDHSRLAYIEALADETGATCAAFLARTAASFTDHGIEPIQRVMTDNHSSYTRSRVVAETINGLSATHVLIRAHCPWQNGKVERYNRSLQTEWAYRQVYLNNTRRLQALAPWLKHDNTQRRHPALGNQSPINRLT